MKAATIALIVRTAQGRSHEVLEILSDDREILLLEGEGASGDTDPLQRIYDYRTSQVREDDEFADYVEDLLSQPFVKPEIQEHGVQWLKSKIRIEQHQRSEAEAAKIIAEYAMKVFSVNPDQRDFLLAGPRANVRIRIFVLSAGVVANAA